ncbi:Internalin-A precursor [Candidatus Izimaplasma bacterium HR1]|jgi:oligopeptide transport system substrate-binding protein|uniref:ABC transporter substrate-binding protein n=1 Tax=Candidatus Izimoplasma sp. HR1 TaxID=1541959 RepID=UPI0004F627AC|nr:Internalin-A precursor [Candidatus Izimaplasma bacterium HR1]
MIKKLIAASMVLLAVLTLSACKATEYTVTFDSTGGNAIEAVVVEEGLTIAAPTAPTKTVTGEVYTFVGWYTEAAGTTAYNFEDPVNADTTLYAKWVLEVVLHFDTRTDATIEAQLLGEVGGLGTAPTAPTRTGYEFAGWFLTKKGLSWLETEAFDFATTVAEETTLFAYWEPVNSKEITYGPEVTYTTSLDSSSRLILNPLVYEWSHEDTFINMLTTDLYVTEVDWDKAIEEGVADFAGDFSKIEAKEFSIESLDFKWILEGATNYPIDSDDDEHLDENGNYDRDAASTFKDTEWTFKIREDLVYEDGTGITAYDYEFTLKMFLDHLLNNYRANLYYKTELNQNGVPIVNAYEYYLGEVAWSEVGFEVVDDYTFTLTTFEAISQSEAVGFGAMPLVQKAAFEASLTTDKTNSEYGTPAHPYVSYGPYILKTWDENQKLVFNKNYDYVLKGTINYKCQVVQIVDDIDQRMALFAAGDLSVAGLSKDYYAQYAESPNVYKSWDGYPQYLIVNLGPTKVTEGGNVQDDILFDVRFRQALLYGFDRKYYATSVYAPNTASLLPVPLDTKSYNQDALYYSESPQHLQLLEDLDIDPATEGYIPARAVQLFDAAYAAWVADGNTGPVVVGLITDNDPFSVALVDYIEEHFETLFNTTGEVDKLDIVIDSKDPTANRAQIAAWDFDMSLNSIGFGNSTGVWWQYQAIAFFGDYIGGGGLGLSQPWDMSTDDGVAAYATQEVTIDLTNTWNYLEELGLDYIQEEELAGHEDMYNWLKADAETGKAAGIYVGPMEDVALLQVFNDTPYDGSAAEPFTGATNDTWNLVAAFEALFFEHVPMIPTVTRSSATIYAENVVIEWPAYSSAFAWGANRYRYLDTDPDFM